MRHGGGSWRSGSATTGLPGSRLPRDFLHLRALRSRTPLLQRSMPPASPSPAAASRQQPPPAESRRATRSSRPSARVPPPLSHATTRDGSRFPFDRFPGIIRLWMGRWRKASSGAAVRAANPTLVVAALPNLRPHRTLHRSLPTHSPKKVSHRMISPEIRAQIRRYFYAEHWKVGTIASELGVHPTPFAMRLRANASPTPSRWVYPSSIPTSSSFATRSINIRVCAPRASTR